MGSLHVVKAFWNSGVTDHMYNRIGYTYADVYDRESEYWQDIEEAQKAQIEAQKNLSKAATSDKQIQKQIISILAQEGKKSEEN